MVLGSPVTRTMVPLDASRRVVLSFEQYDRLKFNRLSRLGRFLDQTVPYALRSHRQYLGHEGITLDDVVALAAIREPRWCSHETFSMDIELHGHITRGATIFDRRYEARWRANMDVILDVDSQGVLDFISGALSRIAPE
jgi:purine nucleosidase